MCFYLGYGVRIPQDDFVEPQECCCCLFSQRKAQPLQIEGLWLITPAVIPHESYLNLKPISCDLNSQGRYNLIVSESKTTSSGIEFELTIALD